MKQDGQRSWRPARPASSPQPEYMIMMLSSNQTDQPLSHDTGTDWQILGELELPFGVNAQPLLRDWLSDVLTPINLHMDFLNKIWTSAEHVATCTSRTETAANDQHIHFVICISSSSSLQTQTWGFFRIEKVEKTADNEKSNNHLVEFYLFPEKQ